MTDDAVNCIREKNVYVFDFYPCVHMWKYILNNATLLSVYKWVLSIRCNFSSDIGLSYTIDKWLYAITSDAPKTCYESLFFVDAFVCGFHLSPRFHHILITNSGEIHHIIIVDIHNIMVSHHCNHWNYEQRCWTI